MKACLERRYRAAVGQSGETSYGEMTSDEMTKPLALLRSVCTFIKPAFELYDLSSNAFIKPLPQ